MNKIRQKIRQFLIYFFGNVLNKAVPFLLLPFITRILSPSDYGLVSLYTAYITLLSSIIGLSGNVVVSQKFFKSLNQDKLLVDIFNISNWGVAVVLFLVFIFSNQIRLVINLPIYILLLGVICAYFNISFATAKSFYQLTGKSFQYVSAQFIVTFLNFSLTLLLLKYFSWKGRVIGIAFSSFVGYLILITIVKSNKERILKNLNDFKSMKEYVILGFSLLPSSIGGWLFTLGDRFIIAYLLDNASVGIYSAAFSLCSVIEVISQSISVVFAPLFFKKMAEGKNKLVNKYSLIIIIFLIITGVLLSLVLPQVSMLVLGPRFKDSVSIIPPIIIGYSFTSLNSILSYYYLHYEMNLIYSKVFISTIVLRLIMSFLIISNYGLIGASYSILISGIITSLILFIVMIVSIRSKIENRNTNFT